MDRNKENYLWVKIVLTGIAVCMTLTCCIGGEILLSKDSLIIAITIVVIFLAFGIGYYNQKRQKYSKAISITAVDLSKSFYEDTNISLSNYSHETLCVSGDITDISNVFGEKYIVVETGKYPIVTIHCDITKYRKGDKVKIYCKYINYNTILTLAEI